MIFCPCSVVICNNISFYSISRNRSPEPEISPEVSPVKPGLQHRLSLTPQVPYMPPNRPPTPSSGFNPFIYGNDVDSVDVATRVAMVNLTLTRVEHFLMTVILGEVFQLTKSFSQFY